MLWVERVVLAGFPLVQPWRLPKARSPLASQVFIDVKDVPGIVFVVKQVADYVVLEQMQSAVYMVAGCDGRNRW